VYRGINYEEGPVVRGRNPSTQLWYTRIVTRAQFHPTRVGFLFFYQRDFDLRAWSWPSAELIIKGNICCTRSAEHNNIHLRTKKYIPRKHIIILHTRELNLRHSVLRSNIIDLRDKIIGRVHDRITYNNK